MKHHDDKPHKEKKFLQLPTYPGGKKAFLDFIETNLVYPPKALENHIEGTVYLEYAVDNVGNISEEVVIHGLGYGCDEEALRLIRMLKYNPKKVRGVRMKTRMKARIKFELPPHLKPGPSVNFNYTPVKPEKQKDPKPGGENSGYGYTITIG